MEWFPVPFRAGAARFAARWCCSLLVFPSVTCRAVGRSRRPSHGVARGVRRTTTRHRTRGDTAQRTRTRRAARSDLGITGLHIVSIVHIVPFLVKWALLTAFISYTYSPGPASPPECESHPPSSAVPCWRAALGSRAGTPQPHGRDTPRSRFRAKRSSAHCCLVHHRPSYRMHASSLPSTADSVCPAATSKAICFGTSRRS